VANLLGIIEENGGASVPYSAIAVEWWARARMGRDNYRACYNQIGWAVTAAVVGGWIEEPKGFGTGARFTLKSRFAFARIAEVA
jgi:hypothetical protein